MQNVGKAEKSFNILGIDPGLTHMGWGVISAPQESYISHGVVSPSKKQSISQRLAYLFRNLNKIMEEYNPTMVAIEKVFVNSSAPDSLTLGMARGVALMVPALYDIPVYEYTPNQIKKTVTGYGHASKDQMVYMVSSILKVNSIEKYDAIDALGVAICHMQHYT